MRTRLLKTLVVAAAILAMAVPWRSGADTIAPGVNNMKTQPDSQWYFTAAAGDFGPGSDPFEGHISLITETKVARGESTEFVSNMAMIALEIVAMELHSTAPVEINYDNGASSMLYDVLVTLGPSTPSVGAYAVTKDPGGGTPDRGLIQGGVDSFFDVYAELTFIARDPGGGDPPDRHFLRDDLVTLSGSVPWSATAPGNYSDPLAGNFYPGFEPPFNGTNVPQELVFTGTDFTWHLRLERIPEPGTSVLFALTGLMLPQRRDRRRRRFH